MGAGNQLTTLAAVKQWLQIDVENTDADELLNRLIKSASAFVLNYLNRNTLALTQFREVYDGYGNQFMVLRQNPVYDIEALSFNGTPCPAAQGDGFTNPYVNGYVLEPAYSSDAIGSQRINLYGWAFPRCRGSVAILYRAGYVMSELHVVPSTPFQVTTNYRYLSNVSVKNQDGNLFTEVVADPSTGEYSVDADGVYTFNAADEDETITITYSYVPADIEQATWELVAERYKYMDRMGYVSKSLGGQETVTFSQSAMPSYTRELLTPYRNVAPI